MKKFTLFAIVLMLAACSSAPVEPIVITKLVPQTVEVTRIVERTVFPTNTKKPTKTKTTQSLPEAIIGIWKFTGTGGDLIEFFPLDNSGEGIITTKYMGRQSSGTYEFIDENSISVRWPSFSTPETHHLKLIGNTLTIDAGGIPWKYSRVK